MWEVQELCLQMSTWWFWEPVMKEQQSQGWTPGQRPWLLEQGPPAGGHDLTSPWNFTLALVRVEVDILGEKIYKYHGVSKARKLSEIDPHLVISTNMSLTR